MRNLTFKPLWFLINNANVNAFLNIYALMDCKNALNRCFGKSIKMN
jgi:hypothetical protein